MSATLTDSTRMKQAADGVLGQEFREGIASGSVLSCKEQSSLPRGLDLFAVRLSRLRMATIKHGLINDHYVPAASLAVTGPCLVLMKVDTYYNTSIDAFSGDPYRIGGPLAGISAEYLLLDVNQPVPDTLDDAAHRTDYFTLATIRAPETEEEAAQAVAGYFVEQGSRSFATYSPLGL